MNRRILIPIVMVLLLMGVVVPAALAAPFFDTIVEENEVINNDVVVFDGDLEVQNGAVVNGDVVVFNGNALVFGRINGDVVMFNGNLETGEDAAITGDCVLLNGDVGGTGSLTGCTAIEGLDLDLAPIAALAPALKNVLPPVPPMVPAVPVAPEMPDLHEFAAPTQHSNGDFFGNFLGLLALTAFMTFLGFLTGAIMPNHLNQIVATARQKPVISGGAGALTAVAVPTIITILIPISIILTFVCIGLLGFPIMILLALGLVAGLFLGWIAIGAWLGDKVFNRGKQQHSTRRTAALGTGLLTLVIGLLSVVPFLFGGTLLAILAAAVGLGATALTQFGMKPYPRLPEIDAPESDEGDNKVEEVLLTLPPEEIPEV